MEQLLKNRRTEPALPVRRPTLLPLRRTADAVAEQHAEPQPVGRVARLQVIFDLAQRAGDQSCRRPADAKVLKRHILRSMNLLRIRHR